MLSKSGRCVSPRNTFPAIAEHLCCSELAKPEAGRSETTEAVLLHAFAFHSEAFCPNLIFPLEVFRFSAFKSPRHRTTMKGRKGLNFPSSRSSMAPLWQSKSLLSIAHKYKQNGPHPSFTGWPYTLVKTSDTGGGSPQRGCCGKYWRQSLI